MSKFRVEETLTVIRYNYIEVEADTLEEALDIAAEGGIEPYETEEDITQQSYREAE